MEGKFDGAFFLSVKGFKNYDYLYILTSISMLEVIILINIVMYVRIIKDWNLHAVFFPDEISYLFFDSMC